MFAETEMIRGAMQRALELAALAAHQGEVPVGAVVLHQDRIVGEGFNQRESAADPTGHAEMLAIRQAAKTLDQWRLLACTLVVTLEPCVMCAGAIVHARLPRLVFGAYDRRFGAVGSIMNLVEHPQLNHRAEVLGGVMAEPASRMLRDFFASRRGRSRSDPQDADGP